MTIAWRCVTLVPLLALALGGSALGGSTGAGAAASPRTETGAAEDVAKGTSGPNIIFILLDDERSLELELGFGRSLPGWTSAVETELIDQGTVFENFFNSTSYCCPSRASYLTGMFAHNHGIYGNNYNVSNGNGGWKRFWELGHEQQSLGVWLQQAGYQTVLIGKFLNQYPNKPSNFLPETYVPAGWHEWYGSFTNDLPFSYYQFRMNENGEVVEYGGETPAYLTDVERDHAVDYIERVAPTGEPFFMFLAPFAPHGPIEAAPRHIGTHKLGVATPPSFNEQDLSDKPQYIQQGAVEFPDFWTAGWNLRLDMSLAIDEMVRDLIAALSAEGVLDQTYIFFTSDNGLLWGQHGITGKAVPYEESIRFPLIVRGPGVPAGISRPQLVLNVDLAPTIVGLAGGHPPLTVDGEVIAELMFGEPSALANWRDSALVELLLAGPALDPGDLAPAGLQGAHVVPAYAGVRTLGHLYVEYETGETELYDLMADPFQLQSLHQTAPPEMLAELQESLQALRGCSGQDCASAARLGAPNARPRGHFTLECVELDCTFDATDSFDLDGEITGYQWNFGDGETSVGPTAEYSYPQVGNYAVTLSVTDDAGDVGVRTRSVSPGARIFSDGFESGDTSSWPAEEESLATSTTAE